MRRFTARGTNRGFTCTYCGLGVPPLANGSYRNHCPRCLYSLHVDVFPGDRAANCGGLLEPVGVDYSGKKGWIIMHRCERCGAVRRNKAALDDAAMPDAYERLLDLSQRSQVER